MTERVLDSSVLMAIAKSETYDADLLTLLEGSVLSSVNYAEVLTGLLDLHISADSPEVQLVFGLLDRIEPFTTSQAKLASDLRLTTSHSGLSFGDRACLALALELEAEIYTADRQWSRVNIGCAIHLIRSRISAPYFRTIKAL